MRVAFPVLAAFLLAGCTGTAVQEASPVQSPIPTLGASPSPRPAPPPTATLAPPGPRAGIFEFPTASHYDDPRTIGGNVIRQWREIEPNEGEYRWDIIDSRLKAWADHGKVATLRVITAGQLVRASPEWIFAKGAAQLALPETGTVYPVFWDPIYLESYLRFVQEMGKRFDGDRRLAFVQISVGMSGEVGLWVVEPVPPGQGGTIVTGTNSRIVGDRKRLLERWGPYGFTRERWVRTVNTIVQGYRRAFPTTPIALMLSDYYEDPGEVEEEAAFAVSVGASLQFNGLTANVEELPSAKHVLQVFERYAGRTTILFEAWGDTRRAHTDPSSPLRQGSLSGTMEAAYRHKASFLSIYGQDIERARTEPEMSVALEEGARRFALLAAGK